MVISRNYMYCAYKLTHVIGMYSLSGSEKSGSEPKSCEQNKFGSYSFFFSRSSCRIFLFFWTFGTMKIISTLISSGILLMKLISTCLAIVFLFVKISILFQNKVTDTFFYCQFLMFFLYVLYFSILGSCLILYKIDKRLFF